MSENDFDVIVVGAGIAGLTAARQLVKHQKKVCILEARNRIGGRIFTRKTPSGKTIELGAQWVGTAQPRILALLSEFSINTTPGLAQGNNLIFLENKLSTYDQTIPHIPFLPFLDLYLNLYRLEKDCLNVPIKTPYNAKYADEWDGMTVKTWANIHFHTQEVHKLLDLFMESVFGVNSNNMSFLYFLSTLHSSHGPIYNIEGSNALFVEGGLTQVCNRIAEELEDCIILNSPVTHISQTRSKVTVQTMTQSYTATKVIVAVPPPLASQISFSPPLPAIRDKLHQRMPMGSVIKCFAIYKRPFWKEKGFSGKIITDSGLVHQVYDASPPDDSYGALLAFLLGNNVLHIDKISESWLADNVIANLVHFFGEEAKEPEEFVFYNWNADPWARGGYSAYMPPGVLTELGKTLLEPTQNIYWASSEMTFEYNGYMEGAIESGMRAANLILNP